MKQKSTPKKQETYRFVIRKYVIARSVTEALKYEGKAPVHEVLISSTQDDRVPSEAIGFEYTAPDEG